MHPTQKPATRAVTDSSDCSPAETLRAAAQYLEQDGWIQGAYYDLDGPAAMFIPPADLLGAIGICVYGYAADLDSAEFTPKSPIFHAARRVLTDYLDQAGELDDGDNLSDWNDKPGRTAEQVIEVCRYAADAYDRTRTAAHTAGGAA